MNPVEVLAVGLSLISLIGNGFNLYLKLQIRAELLEMHKDVLTAVHVTYAPREVVEPRMQRLEERVRLLEERAVTALEEQYRAR